MQAGSTLLLWARDNTNRHLLGWELPVPYVASLHAGLVLAVSPLLARALLHLKTAPGLPTATAKIAFGPGETGSVFLAGEWWNAELESGHVEAGERVTVTGQRGYTLIVKK